MSDTSFNFYLLLMKNILCVLKIDIFTKTKNGGMKVVSTAAISAQ